jgi:uncharacterized membrane protein YhhN
MGSLFGLTGVLLPAMNGEFLGFGFISFLLSNICFIGFAILKGFNGILVLQIGFLFTSILGITRWGAP